MKKFLKVLGIIIGVVILVLVVFFVIQQIKTHKALNTPLYPDNYYEGYAAVAGGSLEAK